MKKETKNCIKKDMTLLAALGVSLVLVGGGYYFFLYLSGQITKNRNYETVQSVIDTNKDGMVSAGELNKFYKEVGADLNKIFAYNYSDFIDNVSQDKINQYLSRHRLEGKVK